MPSPPKPTFVGFGFGPIQAGLFLLEALRSGRFARCVTAEVMPDVVRAVREEGGMYQVNVARFDGIESLHLGPIEMHDPSADRDREELIAAVATASEVATAVPSVRFYRSEGPGSIHRIIARGLELRQGAPLIIYTAENNNRAAEILEATVLDEVAAPLRDVVRAGTRFLNTVIGKMSAVVADPDRVAETGLRTVTSRDPRAFVVESFNHILISAYQFPPEKPFRRGIEVFEEKPDLLPFEEAKLYGHNAAHALAAYIAATRGYQKLPDLDKVPGAVSFVRTAFLREAGEALCRKWRGADALFNPAAFEKHVDDLMRRMLNPFLGDLVERVARDPERKLGWDDRLVGTVRLALRQGIAPERFALGIAAALAYHRPEMRSAGADPGPHLEAIWRTAGPDPGEKSRVLELVGTGLLRLRRWLETGAPPF